MSSKQLKKVILFILFFAILLTGLQMLLSQIFTETPKPEIKLVIGMKWVYCTEDPFEEYHCITKEIINIKQGYVQIKTTYYYDTKEVSSISSFKIDNFRWYINASPIYTACKSDTCGISINQGNINEE